MVYQVISKYLYLEIRLVVVLQKLDAIYDQERQFVKLIACDRKIASTYNIVHFRGTEQNY